MLKKALVFAIFGYMSVYANSFTLDKLILWEQKDKVHFSINDFYRFVYDPKNKTCDLYKNGEKIPKLDPRFGKENANSVFTCATWQKEKYRGCKQVNAKSVSAVAFSYGVYESTDFILGFHVAHKGLDAFIEMECSKQRINF